MQATEHDLFSLFRKMSKLSSRNAQNICKLIDFVCNKRFPEEEAVTPWVPGSVVLRCGCAFHDYDEEGVAEEMQRCKLVKGHPGPCDYSKP